MKIWLCKHSEDIPIIKGDRKFRVGMLADELAINNYEVIWWTSDYNHYKKIKLMLPNITYNGVKLKVADAIPYLKNVSVKRVYNHYQIGSFFTKHAELNVEKPDLIYASMPTLDFAYRATKYAKKNNIPIVIDIRDLWPDVFLDLIPVKFLRKDKFFYPWNKKLSYILNNASGITAITEEYLEWALKKANLERNIVTHRVFPLGYEQVDTSNLKTNANRNFTITFVGTVGYHFDLETIFKAAEVLISEDITFNILGNGDLLEEYKQKYKHLKNVYFAGHVSGVNLQTFLHNSDIGIAPYYNSKNFRLNIPNKPYEYLAYGMPVLSPLEGPTERLILNNNVGYKYEEFNHLDLANKIKLLKNEQILYDEMKKNCIELFESKFEKNKIYSEYINYINEIIEKTKM